VEIAQAAITSGSNCKKVGQVSSQAGQDYVCTKSGKKLIWKYKPVAVKPSTKPTVATTEVDGQSCPTIGQALESQGNKYECRQVANGIKTYVSVADGVPEFTSSSPSAELSLCQIPDQRASKLDNQAIAYPVKPHFGFAGIGSEKVAVVGVDFSDVQGSGSPAEIFKPEIEKATEWLKWYSNDKLKLNFVTSDKWLRAPKVSKFYQAGEHGNSLGGLTQDEVAADYLSAIEKTIDLKNVSAIWIVLPPQITTITGQYVTRGPNYNSSTSGAVTSQIYVVASDTYKQAKLWSYFLHEHLHAEGIHGHFPTSPDMFGLMFWDAAPSRALNSWDQLTFNWLLPEQLYCQDIQKLEPTTVNLIPIEREQSGIHSIMIKLSQSEVLVIESHHREKWSQGLHPGFAGIMAYVVDTTVDAPYEPSPRSTGMWVHFGFSSHGNTIEQSKWPSGTPAYAGPVNVWSLSDVMFQGESFIAEGVRISLKKSGSFDTVLLERAN
jgi:hypothetical protein